jgi:hypothetical protein
VAVDADGNVYVADTNNNRIQKFTGNGVFLAQWGTFGYGGGQFDHPTGVAVDAAGNIYVSDTRNNRIQKFDPLFARPDSAPTGVTATAGNRQATVSFTPPASDGGSAILFYTVTTSPDTFSATGTASPITVPDLTNGKSYTFTVTATNAFGTGPASAPSNSVVPNVVYSVGVSANPAAGGSVTGGGTYVINNAVNLTATAAAGYQFVNWTEGTNVVSTSAAYSFAATANRTLVANFTPVTFTISVTTTGSGGGTVNSVPSGIACANGSPAGCSAPFAPNSPVSLTATPDWKSLFGSWSGDCSGSANPCAVTMSGDKTVIATFNPNFQVWIKNTSSGYASIQEAYDNSGDGKTLLARIYTFYEDLLFGRAISVILQGGMDAGLFNATGFTTVQGTLTIGSGCATVDRLIIR